METLQRKEIRILQCNADGILTKWVELGDWLAKDKVDIALVQETKLKAKNGTPKITVYSNIRFDRPDQPGGGLLCLIKEDIPFTTPKHHNQLSGIVASTTFNVRVSKQKWLTIGNVCIPPNRSREKETIVTDHIPTGVNCFIAGDLSGHYSLRDPAQPTDSRSTRIEEWMSDANFA